MKTYKDLDYLSGNLNIVIDNKTTIGRLLIYDCHTDNILNFKAISVCQDSDEYDENKGINIVKLKLAKQYYSYRKNEARKDKEYLIKILKNIDAQYEFSNNKLQNIEHTLKKYGLDFYG